MIVLVVSFISLGLRAGLVVALSIPLVLAITFVVMEYCGISLQRISLGALIIALGLLVDDAMIAVEMMVARLEVGDTLEKAATYVYTSTAFPMLTGTLVTVAGFIPIGLQRQRGRRIHLHAVRRASRSRCSCPGSSRCCSRRCSASAILPKTMKKHHDKPGRVASPVLRDCCGFCMRWRWITIVATLAVFAPRSSAWASCSSSSFPSSDRPELIVDWNLPQNASIAETKAQMERFEKEALAGDPDVERWSSYVGQGAVRFVLSFDVQPPNPSFGQTIIVTKDLEARERLKTKLDGYVERDFVGTDAYVKLLDLGPPVGRPVQYRLSGPDIANVRERWR